LGQSLVIALCFRQVSHGKRESIAIMPTEIPPQPRSAESHLPWSQRRRISTADLMQGAREVIIVHEEEEYVLHITKTGKLILTK
jgi:hemin uptake protein HemP